MKRAADFGDALRTLGDHHELRDGDNDEDDETDGHVAAHHELTERVDHIASVGVAAGSDAPW